MKTPNLYHGSCEMTDALNFLGGRWRLPILWQLSQKAIRYNELKRQLHGITNIMLTRSLRELEQHNLIARIEYPHTPPHVEYHLTKSGKLLIPILKQLVNWAEDQGFSNTPCELPNEQHTKN